MIHQLSSRFASTPLLLLTLVLLAGVSCSESIHTERNGENRPDRQPEPRYPQGNAPNPAPLPGIHAAPMKAVAPAELDETLDNASGTLGFRHDIRRRVELAGTLEAGVRAEAVRHAILDPSAARRAAARATQLRELRQEMAPLFKKAGRALRKDGPIGTRFASLIGRKDGVEALTLIAVEEAWIEILVDQATQDLVRERPGGGWHVPRDLRANAQQRVDASRATTEAVERAHQRAMDIADKLRGDDPLTSRLRTTLREPLYAATAAAQLLSGSSPPSIRDLPARVEDAILARLVDGEGATLVISERDRGAVSSALWSYDMLASVASDIRSQMNVRARALLEGDALERRVGELLASDSAIVMTALAAITSRPEANKFFLLSSPLGRAINSTRGKSYEINRWRSNDIEVCLSRAESLLADRALNRQALDTMLKEYSLDGKDRVLAELALVNEAVSLAGYGRLSAIASRASDDREHLPAPAPAYQRVDAPDELTVQVDRVDWERDDADLMRSTVFYNPRTPEARRIYNQEFEGHRSVRPFGVFEWNAYQSTSLRDFESRIRNEGPFVDNLASQNDEVVIMINFMPSWLSNSRNDKEFEGHWQIRNAHRPADWDAWERTVRATVNLFDNHDWQRRYEIWNEPDLYWMEDVDAYLELYERTARIIQEADPEALIGGPGVNGWRGGVAGQRGSSNLVESLIEFAGERRLPLDFISWHEFTRDPSAIGRAAETFRAAANAAGLSPLLSVTEWNIPEKSSELAVASFSERMLRFAEAGVESQFFSAWEEFNAELPKNDQVGPWGLLTQRGDRKPEFHTYALFDRLARDAEGVTTLRDDETGMRAIIAKKPGGQYDIIFWRFGSMSPPLEAALGVLAERGVTNRQLKAYGGLPALEQAIRGGNPLAGNNERDFQLASEAYAEELVRETTSVITLNGAGSLDLLEARGVLREAFVPVVQTVDDSVVIQAPPNAVIFVRVDAGGR